MLAIGWIQAAVTPAEAAFEWWRPSTVDAESGLRLEVERPFSWPELRVDRVRFRGDFGQLHFGQLSAGSYRELLIGGSYEFRGPEVGLEGRVITTTTEAAVAGLQGGMGWAIHMGWRFALLHGEGRVSGRNVVQQGVAGEPTMNVEWGRALSARTRLHVQRTWGSRRRGGQGKARLEWSPGSQIKLGLTMESGKRRWKARLGPNAGLGVEVWQESYSSLPVTRGIGLVWNRPEGRKLRGQKPASSKDPSPSIPERAGVALVDLDLEDRTLELMERPWLVPDSLEVWEEPLLDPDTRFPAPAVAERTRSIPGNRTVTLPVAVRSIEALHSTKLPESLLALIAALSDSAIAVDWKDPRSQKRLLPYIVVRDVESVVALSDAAPASTSGGYLETRTRTGVASRWSARLQTRGPKGRVEWRADLDRARPWADGRAQWLWSRGGMSLLSGYGLDRGRNWLDASPSTRRQSRGWFLRARTPGLQWSLDRAGGDAVGRIGSVRMGLRWGDEPGAFASARTGASEFGLHTLARGARFVRGEHHEQTRALRWRFRTAERWGQSRSTDLRERSALVFDRSLTASLVPLRERLSGTSTHGTLARWTLTLRWKKSRLTSTPSVLRPPDAVESRDLGLDIHTQREEHKLVVRARVRSSDRRRDGALSGLKTWYGRLHWIRSSIGAEVGGRGQIRGESNRLHSWIAFWTRFRSKAGEVKLGGLEIRGPRDRRISLDPLGFDGRTFSAPGGSVHVHGSGVVRWSSFHAEGNVLWSLFPRGGLRVETRVRFSL